MRSLKMQCSVSRKFAGNVVMLPQPVAKLMLVRGISIQGREL